MSIKGHHHMLTRHLMTLIAKLPTILLKQMVIKRWYIGSYNKCDKKHYLPHRDNGTYYVPRRQHWTFIAQTRVMRVMTYTIDVAQQVNKIQMTFHLNKQIQTGSSVQNTSSQILSYCTIRLTTHVLKRFIHMFHLVTYGS